MLTYSVSFCLTSCTLSERILYWSNNEIHPETVDKSRKIQWPRLTWYNLANVWLSSDTKIKLCCKLWLIRFTILQYSYWKFLIITRLKRLETTISIVYFRSKPIYTWIVFGIAFLHFYYRTNCRVCPVDETFFSWVLLGPNVIFQIGLTVD